MSIVGQNPFDIGGNSDINDKTNDDKPDDERTKSRSDTKGRVGSAVKVAKAPLKTDQHCKKTDGGEASAAPKRKCNGAGAKSQDLALGEKGRGTNGNGSDAAVVKCPSLASKLRVELAVLESVLDSEKRAKKMAVGRRQLLEDAFARMTAIVDELEKEGAKVPEQSSKRVGSTVLEGYTKTRGPGAEPGQMAKARRDESKSYAATASPINAAANRPGKPKVAKKDPNSRVERKANHVVKGKVATAAKPDTIVKPKPNTKSKHERDPKPSEQQRRTKRVRRRKTKPAHGQVVVEFANSGEVRAVEHLKKDLWQTVTAKRKDVRFDSVRLISGGRMIVQPGDAKTLEALSTMSSETIKVRKLNGMRPKLLVYDVQSDLTATEVAESIAVQNLDRLGGDLKALESRILPRFKTGPRDKAVVNWVIETDPELVQKFETMGRLYLGMSRCRVVRYRAVTRCTNCQLYGHPSKLCRHKATCSHCAEEGHTAQSCPKRQDGSKCINCIKRRYPAGHSATSRKCPSYLRALDINDERTQWV